MSARDDYDTLAPEFRLLVNGAPLPAAAAADLLAVGVHNDVDTIGMFTFTISGWDAAAMQVKWMDDSLFQAGNPVEVEIGYRDARQTLFSGEITGLEPEFPEGRPPTLTVRGYDRLHRMMRARKTCSYTNSKDSDIAARLAGNAGLTPDAQDSKVTHPYVLQHNQTDLAFLLARARRIGYELSVDGSTFKFRERAIKGDPALTLRRDVDLLEFRPRLTTMGQVQELVVRGWNPADKKEIVGRASAGDEPATMQGSETGPVNAQRVFDPTGSALDREPVHSQQEADRIAQQRFADMALGYVSGEGICIGEPRLRAGMLVNIEGLGMRFSGHYYVTHTHHSYSSRRGYRTHFAASRNAT